MSIYRARRPGRPDRRSRPPDRKTKGIRAARYRKALDSQQQLLQAHSEQPDKASEPLDKGQETRRPYEPVPAPRPAPSRPESILKRLKRKLIRLR